MAEYFKAAEGAKTAPKVDFTTGNKSETKSESKPEPKPEAAPDKKSDG